MDSKSMALLFSFKHKNMNASTSVLPFPSLGRKTANSPSPPSP